MNLTECMHPAAVRTGATKASLRSNAANIGGSTYQGKSLYQMKRYPSANDASLTSAKDNLYTHSNLKISALFNARPKCTELSFSNPGTYF